MKKLFFLLLLVSLEANAVMAMFTGRMEYVYTITYQQAVKCEYMAQGQTFWRLFPGMSCPQTVDVY
jgi:hypothetical protein